MRPDRTRHRATEPRSRVGKHDVGLLPAIRRRRLSSVRELCCWLPKARPIAELPRNWERAGPASSCGGGVFRKVDGAHRRCARAWTQATHSGRAREVGRGSNPAHQAAGGQGVASDASSLPLHSHQFVTAESVGVLVPGTERKTYSPRQLLQRRRTGGGDRRIYAAKQPLTQTLRLDSQRRKDP